MGRTVSMELFTNAEVVLYPLDGVQLFRNFDDAIDDGTQVLELRVLDRIFR